MRRRITKRLIVALGGAALLGPSALAAGVLPGTYRHGSILLRTTRSQVTVWAAPFTDVPCQNGNVASGTAVFRRMPIHRGSFAGSYRLRKTFAGGGSALVVGRIAGHFRTAGTHRHPIGVALGTAGVVVTYYTAAGSVSTVCTGRPEPWQATR